ncbi:alpha/beta hydrolase [Lysobacter niastensis]|uniref:Alpha/beta hydrolase n=1 Tax=Lysobacter niastensis TaxID=380629 RepID=A0ABS0BAR3_9GAMM|nr:alpha/beta hydrolase [Lysobacter niastensis]MBF6025383.1 alpha/beta hydrolase [Lysobacter niastensis]
MLRGLMLIVGAAIAVYVCYLALLFLQQRSVMFPGSTTDAFGVGLTPPERSETVLIPASFGNVQGVLLPARTDRRRAPAVLYFHGNAEFVDDSLHMLEPLTAMGVHVLAIEYPGYAGSAGSPSQESLDEAARAGYDWLARRPDVDPARIAAIGRSIGTGPASALSRQRPVRALVLLAPFASIDDFARSLGAPAFIARDRYDNVARLRGFRRPVLIFHGRSDEVIPYRHSEILLKAAPDATLVPLECGHNDCPFFTPPSMQRLRQFFTQAGMFEAGTN